ncbi:hypothetical protein [Lysinibacillus boronitolerans]|uniref:hypothetical protein n=1 Tax=Lysinibacillus boronitolerans TaxID=309788 RepID=UPI00385301EA
MSLEFKHKEKDAIYFEDLDWINEINDIIHSYVLPQDRLNELETMYKCNNEINETFKSVCNSIVKLIQYINEVTRLPVFIVYTNEKLDLEIKCGKNKYSFTTTVVEFSRKLSLQYDRVENCIIFNYPSDFDSELGSRTPKIIEHLSYPAQINGGIVEAQFKNDNIVTIIKQFILGIKEEAKHY